MINFQVNIGQYLQYRECVCPVVSSNQAYGNRNYEFSTLLTKCTHSKRFVLTIP